MQRESGGGGGLNPGTHATMQPITTGALLVVYEGTDLAQSAFAIGVALFFYFISGKKRNGECPCR